MKIVKKLVGNSCFTPSLGKGSSGVVVEWNVPMDIEEKTYDITMRGIDKKGNIEAITFPARVPKTKPIQSKLENNELTVIDKTSPLYGMKMKGHSGEDISNLKIRAVEYEDVWKKRVKKKSHKDVKEHIVFVADNIPKALDVKMPEWMDSYNERINIGMHSYTYKREILVGQFWERGIGEHYLYDKTDAYVYLNKDNHSEIFLIVLEKAQNRNKQ